MSKCKTQTSGQDLQTSYPIQEAVTVVKSNQPVNGQYRKLILHAPAEILNCQPGQFFHLLCPLETIDQPYLRRPMSIYGYYPQKRELHFLYKVTGEGTRTLAGLNPNDKLNVLGPLGVGFHIEKNCQNLLLLARGVGLATLAPLALEAKRLGRNLTAICSARSEDVLMSVDYFRNLGAQVITVTDSQNTSNVENIKLIIEQLIADGKVDSMYTCGSNRFLKLLQDIGQQHNISGEIALEQQMACGVGMCQCCVRSFNKKHGITHERVCREGPVFKISEAMAW